MSSTSLARHPDRDRVPNPDREDEPDHDAMKPVTNLVEVKDALDRAAAQNRYITIVFKLFISMGVVRRELLRTPGREVTVFLISTIELIRDLCVYGKHNHPELTLDNRKLVLHLSLFTVYAMLGVSAVKTALIEESCGDFHTDVIAKMTCAPALDAFELSDDEKRSFEADVVHSHIETVDAY